MEPHWVCCVSHYAEGALHLSFFATREAILHHSRKSHGKSAIVHEDTDQVSHFPLHDFAPLHPGIPGYELPIHRR
jgi:hypothetical protein